MALSTITLLITLILFSNALFKSAHAAPAISSELITRQSFVTLSPMQISTLKPFTFFAASAYCNVAKTSNWSCGPNCDANPNFRPIASGGDGGGKQFWYVGFDPTLQTVIVAHQGTDTTKILSLLTDMNITLDQLNPILFPGISSNIKVHQGFAREHAKTATDVLAAVQEAISTSGLNHVTLVGHSLGGSLALLDSVYLPLHLPNLKFRTISYGVPRVGNRAFADYVDAHTDLTHINNKEDIVPILPGRFLGFRHPQGEVHIQQGDSWISCPGQDNTDVQCTVGDVKNIFLGNIGDHNGPYDGVTIGC